MDWNLEEAVSYYRSMGAPADQNALINLLKEIQQERGSISYGDLGTITRSYGIQEGLLLALIRRIPSLRLAGKHCLELCSGPNCSKKAQLANFVEKNWGTNPEHFTVKYIPCMRLCGKGPNIRWDGQVYNGADEALLEKLLRK